MDERPLEQFDIRNPMEGQSIENPLPDLWRERT